MKILGVKLEEKVKLEIKDVLENHEHVVEFLDDLENLFSEVKRLKINSLIIDGDIFEDEELILLIEKLNKNFKRMIVIVLGERSTLNIVAGTIKAGAYDYVLKPVDGIKIMKIIEKALKDQKLKAEKVNSRTVINFEDSIIGTNQNMIDIYKLIGKVSESNVSVLITGEHGTGKELFAKAIHKFSNRAESPYISVNCTAIPSDLMERELFGYEKSSGFEGLIRKVGKLEQVNGGTFFLDEIGDMSPDIQAKFLRVLQENEFARLGSLEAINSDIRFIASSNQDLETMIMESKFREELYHRLKVVEIIIPPLRERIDDIPFLIDHFIKVFNDELNKDIKGVSKPAMKKLMKYDWPGNVRELKNALKSAMAVCRGTSILFEDLPANVIGSKISKRHGDIQDWVLADWIEGELDILKQNNEKNYYNSVVSRVERELIRQVLESTNGKKVDAAEVLGITRNTLRAKMNNYGLE